MSKKNFRQKIYYYKDELNDEFAGSDIDAITIDENYDYGSGKKFQIIHFLLYKKIVRPLAFLFIKLHYGHRIVGKHKIREALKNNSSGIYLYGNHTNNFADTIIPSRLTYPYDAYVVVNADNVSLPVLGENTKYLGAIPLPGNIKAYRNFSDALKRANEQKAGITIYPEAHIWPYYTKIRPFGEGSFGYPVSMGAQVFSFTNTYQKRRFRKTPRIVTYVDGPFKAPEGVGRNKEKKELRNQVYERMTARAKHNNVELIKYVKVIE